MKVAVYGAGAIGASLGIALSSVGVAVRMLARRSLAQSSGQLRLLTIDGRELRPGRDLEVIEAPTELGAPEVCLVTVKSRDTEDAARTLACHLPPTTVVISFQNGLRNGARLRTHLGPRAVTGMVSFNVVRPHPAQFEQATSGPLCAGVPGGDGTDAMRELAAAFDRAGFRLDVRADIMDVAAGKLLLNLNNGLCAATGLTIAQSLRDRTSRRCFAALIAEALPILRAGGYRPRPAAAGLPPRWLPALLRLPDAVVLRIARSLVTIEPTARSSTLQDLLAGRPTEIDDLSGEVVALAAAQGRPAPANAAVTAAVHELEAQAGPLRFLTPATLTRAMQG